MKSRETNICRTKRDALAAFCKYKDADIQFEIEKREITSDDGHSKSRELLWYICTFANIEDCKKAIEEFHSIPFMSDFEDAMDYLRGKRKHVWRKHKEKTNG